MRKVLLSIPASLLFALMAFALPASAGSAHFVGTPIFTTSNGTITVSAKEAGLGDLPQIHVVLSGTAECINPGGNHPKAGIKTSFTQAADEPVQNGQSTYEISATPAFSPSCSPPMEVVFTSVLLTDTSSGISAVPVRG